MNTLILEVNPFVNQQTLTTLTGEGKLITREYAPPNLNESAFYEYIIHKAQTNNVDRIEILSSEEAFKTISEGLKASEQKLYSANKLIMEHI